MKRIILIVLGLMMLASALGRAEENNPKKIGDQFQGFWDRRAEEPGPNGSKKQRAVFLKTHGCAKATFTTLEVPGYKIGLFAKAQTRQAWVRISSDERPIAPDQANNTIGFALKVLGVDGVKVLPGEENFNTHDFVVQNHHIFFVDTAKDFMEFTDASLKGKFDEYVVAHPFTKTVLDAMAKPVGNSLNSDFWSTVPSKFGTGFAKYKIVPCILKMPEAPANDPNYLQARLERDLRASGGCFQLQIQKQKGDMPLDKATVEWSEAISQPVTVAMINIAPQDIRANAAVCEQMSFNAWHALPAHEPVGSVNEARKHVYKRLADIRRARTQVPVSEPQPDR